MTLSLKSREHNPITILRTKFSLHRFFCTKTNLHAIKSLLTKNVVLTIPSYAASSSSHCHVCPGGTHGYTLTPSSFNLLEIDSEIGAQLVARHDADSVYTITGDADTGYTITTDDADTAYTITKGLVKRSDADSAYTITDDADTAYTITKGPVKRNDADSAYTITGAGSDADSAYTITKDGEEPK